MNINKAKAVAFTGHRQERISTDKETLFVEIYNTIRELYVQGYNTFITGMAEGFDLLSAEAVLKLRDECHSEIRLIAVIPFRLQAGRFTSENKECYYHIANIAECVTLAENYYTGCFHRRNDYMIDNASTIIAYFDKVPGGGTYYTVNRAIRKGLTVINLHK